MFDAYDVPRNKNNNSNSVTFDFNNSTRNTKSKVCPNRSHIVIINATKTTLGTSDYTGVGTLSHRLDNIVGFRVVQCHIGNVVSADDATTGPLYGITSGKLGRQIGSNPFQLGTSASGPAQTITAVSNLIGIANISSAHYSNNNAATLALPEGLNPRLMFSKPTTIEWFDWAILPFAGVLTNSVPVTIQLVLEFFPTCSC